MKIKKLSSIVATVMLSLSMITTSLPIYAIDETQKFNNDSSATVYINNTQSSSFLVVVPKVITLGSDKSSSYTVEVDGDIDSLEKVKVIPDESVTMKDNFGHKADVIGIISQDKKEWLCDEMLINGNGNVFAPDLSVGEWSGVFNFNIQIDVREAVTLSEQFLDIGTNGMHQVNAYMGKEDVTDLLKWDSNNENITVNNGLIRTKASAKPGDSATITVSLDDSASNFSVGLEEENNDAKILASMQVNVIDIAFTNDTEMINEINILPGENTSVEATIIPGSSSGIVH